MVFTKNNTGKRAKTVRKCKRTVNYKEQMYIIELKNGRLHYSEPIPEVAYRKRHTNKNIARTSCIGKARKYSNTSYNSDTSSGIENKPCFTRMFSKHRSVNSTRSRLNSKQTTSRTTSRIPKRTCVRNGKKSPMSLSRRIIRKRITKQKSKVVVKRTCVRNGKKSPMSLSRKINRKRITKQKSKVVVKSRRILKNRLNK